MDVSFSHFLSEMAGNPVLLITVALTLGVIFVNGWTDAPNAIATCVTTRCMNVRTAIIMSAVFNFLGVFVMTKINSSVASTISNMVDFGGNTHEALVALCAALFSIVVYSVGASLFGIPTSESHSLIAGLSGAAIAIQSGIGGINMGEWAKVLYGLVLSLALGFATGWAVCKLVTLVCRGDGQAKNRPLLPHCTDIWRRRHELYARRAGRPEIHRRSVSGPCLLQQAKQCRGHQHPCVAHAFLCSVVMALGTSVGGEKIIKSVGMDMVRLEKYQGFSADIAAALCLLYSSLFGIPVSTTHTKTSAIMGVGAVKRLSAINFGVVKDMVLTWIFTFPGCGLISFIMAKLFMAIF